MENDYSDDPRLSDQLEKRIRNDSIVVIGALALIGSIIGTCIVEGLYVNYLDDQFRSLSQNKCVQGDNHGQGQQGN